MEKINVDGFDFNKEIIAGVTVVHTGLTEFVYDNDGKALPIEVLRMYDANGNQFYSNCSSTEEAEQLVEKLKAEGKTAVIGPKAPMRNYTDGRPMENPMENWVGVFIVNQLEKEQGYTDETPKKHR